MANPQLQNGYFRIANEIAEALMRVNLSAYQSRILWAIFRKTYGWKKKEDWISNSQLIELTGIKKQHIHRTIQELIGRKMLIKNGRKYSFQKDPQQWQKYPNEVTNPSKTKYPNEVTPYPNEVTPVPSGGYKSNLYRDPQKKDTITKDTFTKDITHAIKQFMSFWSESFRTKFGTLYHPNGKKEELIVKELLGSFSLDELKGLVEKFFELDDPWIRKAGYTIGIFYSQINKLNSATREHPSHDQYRRLATEIEDWEGKREKHEAMAGEPGKIEGQG